MASLKEIKTRIASVNSTRKITSAMKMVASSKLHHAQTAIQNMLPYENLLEHILKSFLISTPETNSPYESVHGKSQRVALVVYTSNSSLCGGFNNNTIKMMLEIVAEYKAQGIDDIVVYPVGRKVEEKARKEGFTVACSFAELADKPNAEGCRQIAHELGEQFLAGKLSKVELIYHHFKSAGSQILTSKTFLPIDLESELERDHERDLTMNVATKKAVDYLRQKGRRKREEEANETAPLNDNFIVEPDMNTVLSQLLPKMAHLMLYTALLDSVASEHAARMVAMQTATDNADELLRMLNLQYNKGRQQAITSELLDIVGGSVNN